MSWTRQLVCIAGVCVALGLAGCAGKKEEPAEPVKSEEELRQEAEAARRQQETETLASRATELVAAARQLQAGAGSGELVPAALEQSLAALAAPIGEVERLLAELRQAGAGGWEAAKSRLEAALGALEAAKAKAAQAAGDWSRRQAEAAGAPGEGVSRVVPKTGLIEGLDGGDYERYLVSVVETAQRRLRRSGHYAGAVDGELDLATMEAIGRYQAEQGIQVSGVPSPVTRHRLFEGSS